MNRNALKAILIPVCALLILLLGFLVGRKSTTTVPAAGTEDKLVRALRLIQEQYVDTISPDELADMALRSILESLDPHSEYIPREELVKVNEDLSGSFSGVGISFQLVADSVTVVDVITGGPAEKLGILAGDRVISANGVNLTGPEVTNEDVFKNLRGKKGTKVELEIKRPNSPKIHKYTVTRGDIPVHSVDAAYLMDDGQTAYIKLSNFTANTYKEFMSAALKLIGEGAQGLVLDLRGNPGGYMDQAVLIANEFLPSGRKIVFTKARSQENRMEAVADGTGMLKKLPVAVLINEYSASASEIIAGAIQDNDRGVVVGRRSFGKGLVQSQIELPDQSAIRLTVARYYTPSGRCIQKEYAIGESLDYDMDILNRYDHGEFYHLDSIKMDKSKAFRTLKGRKVYGGGGIMPDYFVPEDTVSVTSYFINVSNAGLFQQYAMSLADRYRPLMCGIKTAEHLLNILPDDEKLLDDFANFAEVRGVPAQWYYIDISRPLILGQIKAFAVRDLLDYNQFYKVFNATDRTIQVALDVLKSGKLPASPQQR